MKVDEVFNKCSSYDDIDTELPTLIIGLENARKYIEDFNILDKEYGNVYWTFKKTERRDDHTIDIQKFYDMALGRITFDVHYRYLNLATMDFTSVKNFITYIRSPRKKTCTFTKDGNMMFIYDKNRKTVYGLSLSLTDYIGIDRKKVIGRILSNRRNEYVKDFSFITERMKKVTVNDQYLIPVFYDYFFN